MGRGYCKYVAERVKSIAGIGYSQSEVARRAGVSLPTLLKYYSDIVEAGRAAYEAKIKEMKKLAIEQYRLNLEQEGIC